MVSIRLPWLISFFRGYVGEGRRGLGGGLLTTPKPPVEADVVYVQASAEGWAGVRVQRREFVRAYRPIEINGRSRTAIAWTASASVVAVIEMVREGVLPTQGFLKQEEIPLARFLATRTGSLYGAGGSTGKT